MFDTYGFPVDLTALILSEKGFTLNQEEFNIELEKQKNRSRAAAVVETDDWVVLFDDDNEEEFIGYDTLEAKIKITRYRKVSSKHRKRVLHVIWHTKKNARRTGHLKSS